MRQKAGRRLGRIWNALESHFESSNGRIRSRCGMSRAEGKIRKSRKRQWTFVLRSLSGSISVRIQLAANYLASVKQIKISSCEKCENGIPLTSRFLSLILIKFSGLFRRTKKEISESVAWRRRMTLECSHVANSTNWKKSEPVSSRARRIRMESTVEIKEAHPGCRCQWPSPKPFPILYKLFKIIIKDVGTLMLYKSSPNSRLYKTAIYSCMMIITSVHFAAWISFTCSMLEICFPSVFRQRSAGNGASKICGNSPNMLYFTWPLEIFYIQTQINLKLFWKSCKNCSNRMQMNK